MSTKEEFRLNFMIKHFVSCLLFFTWGKSLKSPLLISISYAKSQTWGVQHGSDPLLLKLTRILSSWNWSRSALSIAADSIIRELWWPNRSFYLISRDSIILIIYMLEHTLIFRFSSQVMIFSLSSSTHSCKVSFSLSSCAIVSFSAQIFSSCTELRFEKSSEHNQKGLVIINSNHSR